MTNLAGHSVRSELLALYVIETLLCFVAFYAILNAGLPPGVVANQPALLGLAGLLAIAAGLAAGAAGLYQPDRWLRAGRVFAGMVLVGVLVLFATQLAMPRLLDAAGIGWGGQLGIVLAFAAAAVGTRAAFTAMARNGLLRRRIILLAGPAAQQVRTALRGDAVFEIVAELPLQAVLANPSRLRAGQVSAVIAEDPASLPPTLREVLAAYGITLWSTTAFIEARLGRVDLERLPPGWMEGSRTASVSLLEAGLRRGFDLALSSALLLITLPVLAITAVAIKLDSPGPVFYRQTRVGQHGRVFTLFKFRSMTVTAEQNGAVWAQKNDPRVTRVGKFIRLTRIDEIPQVFNVLRGDMAFIGPRPERPEFVARLAQIIPHYNARAAIRPGITGWAQVSYPYGASDEDSWQKLTYDLYYVRRRSLFLDLIILVSTVRVVLFQEGSR
jgi:exopolysaccharide biosynthesis polyprenyl glycosylphosphotransferase